MTFLDDAEAFEACNIFATLASTEGDRILNSLDKIFFHRMTDYGSDHHSVLYHWQIDESNE